MRKKIFNLNGDNNGYISDATIHKGVAYLAGQMSIDPVTGKSIHGNMAEQTTVALNNLKAVINGIGATLDDVLFINIYITDEDLFLEMNEVYAEVFKDNPPARATLAMQELYDHLLVEFTAVVAI